MNRTRINWQLFEKNDHLSRSVAQFASGKLETYDNWIAFIIPSSAVREIRHLKVALPLADARHRARLWATRRFGPGWRKV